MGRSDYFVIGAVLASVVIAGAISYLSTVFDSFSETRSDQEFWPASEDSAQRSEAGREERDD